MKKINPKHRRGLINLLMLAFENNSSVRMITGRGWSSKLRLRGLITCVFKHCERFGKVLVSEDGKAGALVLFPDQVSFLRFPFYALLWNLWMAFGVIGPFKLGKVMCKEALLKRHRPDGALYYLWFIGVSPEMQRKGLGSKLLNELVGDAMLMNRVICLETSMPENLPWYQTHGFDLYHKLDTADDPLYFFKRQALVV